MVYSWIHQFYWSIPHFIWFLSNQLIHYTISINFSPLTQDQLNIIFHQFIHISDSFHIINDQTHARSPCPWVNPIFTIMSWLLLPRFFALITCEKIIESQKREEHCFFIILDAIPLARRIPALCMHPTMFTHYFIANRIPFLYNSFIPTKMSKQIEPVLENVTEIDGFCRVFPT